MKKLLLLPLFLFVVVALFAQVEKNVVVEHFTNTRCGICTNRNPGFFENLNNHPDILHVAFHPSAPYSNCEIHLSNPEENDARTNYYDIYGGTPRLVIQGEPLIANADYSDAAIFEPYLSQTTPVSMMAYWMFNLDGSYAFFVEVTTEAENDLSDLEMYLAVVEDTVFYEAPNGEDMHFNVFRKRVQLGESNSVSLMPVGETLTLSGTVSSADLDIAENRLKAIAILQNAETKEVVQAVVSGDMLIGNTNPLPELQNVKITPNPTDDFLNITLSSTAVSSVVIRNVAGQMVEILEFENQIQIDMSNYVSGLYFIEIANKDGRKTERVVKY